MTHLVVIACVLAALFAGSAQAAVKPAVAARATRDCLRAHGWRALIVGKGATVNARAPRKFAAYPYTPWFSIAFYADGTFAETRLRLNRSEARIATGCRRAAIGK
jgi:hypothetical protein